MAELSLTPEEEACLQGNCKKCGRVHVTLVRKASPLRKWAVRGPLLIMVGLLTVDLLVDEFSTPRRVSPWDSSVVMPVWAIWTVLIGGALVVAFQTGLVTNLIWGFSGKGNYFICSKCGRTWRAD